MYDPLWVYATPELNKFYSMLINMELMMVEGSITIEDEVFIREIEMLSLGGC